MTTPRAVAPQSLVKTQTRFFKTALTDRPYADPIGTPEVRISRFSQHPQPASPAATHRTTIPLELLSLHSFKVFYTSATHSLTHLHHSGGVGYLSTNRDLYPTPPNSSTQGKRSACDSSFNPTTSPPAYNHHLISFHPPTTHPTGGLSPPGLGLRF